MKIGEVKISFPYITYKTVVSHSTPRKTTAMEWVILEAIRKYNLGRGYGSLTVDQFFSNLFMIADTDLLLKPCLMGMQDANVIIINQFDDSTSLKTLLMQDLELTEKGNAWRVKGELPAVQTQDAFKVIYDLYRNRLETDENRLGRLHEQAEDSISVMGTDIDPLEISVFPAPMVLNHLEEVKNSKEKPLWLEKTTRIDSLEESSEDLTWINSVRNVSINADGVFEVDEVDDNTLLKTIFDDFGKEQAEGSVPNVKIDNFDEDLKLAFLPSEIQKKVEEYSQKQEAFILGKEYKNQLLNIRNKTINRSFRYCVLEESGGFKVDRNGLAFVIMVPDKVLPAGIQYIDSNNSICEGIFDLKVGDSKEHLRLGYIPAKDCVDIKDVVERLVVQYYEHDYLLLLLLIKYEKLDMFNRLFEDYLNTIKTLKEKADVILKLNKECKDVLKRKAVTAKMIEQLMVIQPFENVDIIKWDEAVKLISDYGQLEIFKANDELYKNLLLKVFEKAEENNSLEKLWSMLSMIKRSNERVFNSFKNVNWFKPFYTQDILKQLFEVFVSDLQEIKADCTNIEKNMRDMKTAYHKTTELLKELKWNSELSDTGIMQELMDNRHNLSGVNQHLNTWNTSLAELKKLISAEEFEAIVEGQAKKIIDNMQHLSEDIKYFYDSTVEGFKGIYILDTCAVVNHPELLETFNSGKNCLVIPITVLEELDNLKTGSDEERAAAARHAIKYIAALREEHPNWLKLGDTSQTDLLPADLQQYEKNDYRIISVALKYFVKKPWIVTDDLNAGNIAESLKLRTIASEKFLEEHDDKGKKIKKNAKITRSYSNSPDNGNVIKNQNIKVKALAKELNISAPDLINLCGSRFGKLTINTMLEADKANRVRNFIFENRK